MEISAKDLRFKTSFLFELLNKGEEIILTYRGKAKARILPIKEKENKEDDELFGLWEDRDLDVNEYIKELRKGRKFDI